MGETPLDTIRVAPELRLTAPDGQALLAREVRVRVAYDGAVLRDVVLLLELSPEDWDRADAGGWFNAPPDVRSPCFAGGFHDQAPVEVEAALDSDAVTLVALVTEDIWEVGAAIRFARVTPALHRTESWRAQIVKQQRGPLKTGFTTTWGGWQPPQTAG